MLKRWISSYLPTVVLRRRCLMLGLCCMALGKSASAQMQATYYIDGFHGGVWGHYPDWNTRFMVDMLKKHPYWKINLEIEPETWARAARVDPEAYAEFKAMISGPASTGRIEYVNPSYAQSYLFTVDGESMIRQFQYGMQMLRQHFPGIQFTSYSSEEPCFTSALPQILQSFGIKHASLKNPNTCFGGYTAAHGGELVNWQGPDGSTITTVPRYEIEALLPQSTWQTIAWNNSPRYINAAFQYGIQHPLGMTLQDAGWKGGPFIGGGDAPRTQNQYVTWRDYFKLVQHDAKPVWPVSQEDIKVSLVWGSQVTQRIAQQVRTTENKLLSTEKLLALTGWNKPTAWPQAALDSAWRTLMLSEHHDCWIVPYNGSKGDTWADKVVRWTSYSNHIADSLTRRLANYNVPNTGTSALTYIVYNTQLNRREEPVEVPIPDAFSGRAITIVNAKGVELPVQAGSDSAGRTYVIFNADVPAFGYSKYTISSKHSSVNQPGAHAEKLTSGNYKIETDRYTLLISPAQGGSISSLYDKKLHKEFVDQQSPIKFNSFRGNFYQDGGLKTSTTEPAEINVLENGPVRVKLQITGRINGTVYKQVLTLAENQPVIDVNLTLDWKQNTGIGEDTPKGTYDWKAYHKAFYNDREKLLAVFPLNLKGQKVYKNAPFDVTESRLKNTFFTSWDSIKNNVLLNWVDVTDAGNQYGMALFTDHTTNYTHGEDFPLGLTLQYSGMGLWGRNYTIDGPTHIHYALLPHGGKWDKAKVWSASAAWNEPLIAAVGSHAGQSASSLISVPAGGLSLTAAQADQDTLTIRVFNAEGKSGKQVIKPNFTFRSATVETLGGDQLETLSVNKADGAISFYIPKFGIRTLRFTHVRPR